NQKEKRPVEGASLKFRAAAAARKTSGRCILGNPSTSLRTPALRVGGLRKLKFKALRPATVFGAVG
ncbi:MAG TPA: hypothetical protein VGI19_16515, partial [Candidatus Cybelea sp.]